MEHPDTNLEYQAIDEDDVFYAELRRQVLLLTAEEDEEFPGTKYYKSNPETKNFLKQGTERSYGSFGSALQPGIYFNSVECQVAESGPACLVNLWRKSDAGTGVFIPQVVKQRTRYRPRRMNDKKTRRMFMTAEK